MDITEWRLWFKTSWPKRTTLFTSSRCQSLSTVTVQQGTPIQVFLNWSPQTTGDPWLMDRGSEDMTKNKRVEHVYCTVCTLSQVYPIALTKGNESFTPFWRYLNVWDSIFISYKYADKKYRSRLTVVSDLSVCLSQIARPRQLIDCALRSNSIRPIDVVSFVQ